LRVNDAFELVSKLVEEVKPEYLEVEKTARLLVTLEEYVGGNHEDRKLESQVADLKIKLQGKAE